MRRFLLIITAIMLALVLSACGVNYPSAEASGSVHAQTNAGNAPSAYTAEEVWFERDGMRIYGELYLPEGSGKHPLVILSHGFGGNHTYTEGYAKAFAENGIAAYAFDFIGGARPAVVSLPEHIEQYDTILLGYPIWGGQAPNILYTFLESVELHHATVLPFCTSNMVSPGTSAINLQALTDETVTWLPAQRIANNSTEEDLYSWARSLVLDVVGGQDGIRSETEGAQEMKLIIGDTPVSVSWEENPAVEELRRMSAASPITVEMSMYGGFEQVGDLGVSLPRDDVQTVTNSGDIVLYAGNQIVLFYGSNSWSYTKLGKLEGLSDNEITALLASGDISLTIVYE